MSLSKFIIRFCLDKQESFFLYLWMLTTSHMRSGQDEEAQRP